MNIDNVLKFNNPVIPRNKIELLSTKESLVRQWVSILNDKIKTLMRHLY